MSSPWPRKCPWSGPSLPSALILVSFPLTPCTSATLIFFSFFEICAPSRFSSLNSVLSSNIGTLPFLFILHISAMYYLLKDIFLKTPRWDHVPLFSTVVGPWTLPSQCFSVCHCVSLCVISVSIYLPFMGQGQLSAFLTTCSSVVMYHPAFPSGEKDLCRQLLGALPPTALSSQFSSGIDRAEESCLTQGHACFLMQPASNHWMKWGH